MRTFLALLGFLALTSGCGSYRVLREAKSGGTVALEGAHDGAREKAEKYMRTQCPWGYEITEEGEAQTEVGDTREWHVTYVCTGAQAPRVARIAI